MNIAYADASVFVALAFHEPEASRMRRRMLEFELVVTSTLTEAEVLSAITREQVNVQASPLLGAQLIGSSEPLTPEIEQVLRAGYLRGADCWHVAVALNFSPDRDLTFLSLDKPQRAIAAKLGFKI